MEEGLATLSGWFAKKIYGASKVKPPLLNEAAGFSGSHATRFGL